MANLLEVLPEYLLYGIVQNGKGRSLNERDVLLIDSRITSSYIPAVAPVARAVGAFHAHAGYRC